MNARMKAEVLVALAGKHLGELVEFLETVNEPWAKSALKDFTKALAVFEDGEIEVIEG